MQLGRAIQTFALYNILSEKPVCCIAHCFAKLCLSLHIFKFITSKVIPAVVVVLVGDRQPQAVIIEYMLFRRPKLSLASVPF